MAEKEVDRVSLEVHAAKSIYQLLFPDRNVLILFRDGNDPTDSHAEVRENVISLNHKDIPKNYLGCVSLTPNKSSVSDITISVEIPRLPTQSEIENNHDKWAAKPGLRTLFRVSPMAYEMLRHAFELYRKRHARKAHPFDPLPIGEPIPDLRPPAPRGADDRPAILIGLHWLEVGGAEKFGLDTVEWALSAGLRVFLVAEMPALQRLAHKLPDHPDLHFIRLDRYLPRRFWPSYVEALVREENIRLVHIHHCAPLYSCLAHIRITCPWVQVIDSTHIVEHADHGYPRISGVHTNLIDMHHVISRDLAAYYRDTFHQRDKVKVGRLLDKAETVTDLPPLSLHTGKKTLNVAFVGRMVYQKRPAILAYILRALRDWCASKGVEFHATVVGDGPMKPTLDGLVRRFGISDCVTLEPGDVDVSALLRASDILLVPSSNEGLALVCYEAIEQGCVPISTDVGAQRELVPKALLVDWRPDKTVRETVRIVERLLTEAGFRDTCEADLHERYSTIAAENTAKELLSRAYAEVARGETLNLAALHDE